MREKPYRSQLPENVVKWLKRRRNRMNIVQKIRFVGRLNNTIKSREYSLTHCRDWSDKMFRMQTGLTRPLFNHILKNMGEYIPQTDVVMAQRAYGKEICNELKLHITMRMLKGAKYLDMDWYSVSVWHVWDLTSEVLKAVIKLLQHNLSFPYNDKQKLENLKEQWHYVQIQKYGSILTEDICAAGDGLLIRTTKPFKRLGMCAKDYYNRKSTYGFVVQGFCDAWCRFVFFDCSHAGATNDISAYYKTILIM